MPTTSFMRAPGARRSEERWPGRRWRSEGRGARRSEGAPSAGVPRRDAGEAQGAASVVAQAGRRIRH